MNGDQDAITNGELGAMLRQVTQIARDAGAVIMRFYEAGNAAVHIKSDGTPWTDADLASSDVIETRLKAVTSGVTFVSEENDADPCGQSLYWVIDPLDGTQEFIDRTGGFAVKIALIHHNQPVLGVVYAPVFNTMYTGLRDGLAMRQTGRKEPKHLSVRDTGKYDLRVLFNQTHADRALYDEQRERFRNSGVKLPEDPYIYPGLPRNLLVAEGLADFNVMTGRDATLRGGGYEWDNAPDWLLLRNAGGALLRLSDGAPLTFGDPRQRMPSYIAIGDKNLGKKLFPEP
ncbi:MAG TPA: 3'(2'),5'-bisphosphate nucleotidase CysQ [Alphaproteobacteria bacterium]|jgi:3'(2'), 5'-bisphosphate nucleotidase